MVNTELNFTDFSILVEGMVAADNVPAPLTHLPI